MTRDVTATDSRLATRDSRLLQWATFDPPGMRAVIIFIFQRSSDGSFIRIKKCPSPIQPLDKTVLRPHGPDLCKASFPAFLKMLRPESV